MAPVSRELNLVNSMMSLTANGYFTRGEVGPVLWWEWKCPTSAWYGVRTEGIYSGVFIARRRTTPQGPAAAGEWDKTGINNRNGYFEGGEGEVFDIAVTSRGDTSNYGELTLRLWQAPATLPDNASEKSPTLLPATVPFQFRDEWLGTPLPGNAGGGGTVELWYRFTAQAAGYYKVNSTGRIPEMVDGEISSPLYEPNDSGRVFWFSEGGGLLLRYPCLVYYNERLLLDVARADGTPGNDAFSNPANLGSAQEFTLLGHASMATMELNEPLVPRAGASPGTLWWRWTAPSDGWLAQSSSNGGVVQIWQGRRRISELGDGRIPGYFGQAALRVEMGRTYLLRAGITGERHENVCASRLQFTAQPQNTTRATAQDLGTSRLPVWEPGYTYGVVAVGEFLWFRWTASETIRAEFTDPYNITRNMIVSAGPRGPALADPEDSSFTYLFHAGQTYWFQLRRPTNNMRWAIRETSFSAHGDISSALVLDSVLPAGGTISMRGDMNSEQEIELLAPLVWQANLANNLHPVIWWEWQAPSTGWVRCFSDASNYIEGGFWAFDSAGVRPLLRIDGDSTGLYLEAEKGHTYRFAGVGTEGAGQVATYAHLELRAVAELAPANDTLAGAVTIPQQDWRDYLQFEGVHRGTGVYDPLYLQHFQASLDAGEPPVSLILGEEGQVIPQTATTWWKWTAHTSAVFKLRTASLSRARTGGGDPGPVNDVTLSLYTGNTLAALLPVPVYESIVGDYLFRATAGVQYVIRVASGASLVNYRLQPVEPSMDDSFDFHALERLMFEDVGGAWESFAGDGVPNYFKLAFGMDYYLRADHPVNIAAARGRLPRAVESPSGIEFRCQPDLTMVPAGRVEALAPYCLGRLSEDLNLWQFIYPETTDNGELTLRLSRLSVPRAFLKWDIFDRQNFFFDD